MYVDLTRVRTGGEPTENVAIMGDELLGWLKDMDGFLGIVVLRGEDVSLGLRMQFLGRMTSVADVEFLDVSAYDVAFTHLSPRLLTSATGG